MGGKGKERGASSAGEEVAFRDFLVRREKKTRVKGKPFLGFLRAKLRGGEEVFGVLGGTFEAEQNIDTLSAWWLVAQVRVQFSL